MKNRCWNVTEQVYIDYHDKEWGVPVHDDRLLFEYFVLEGAQAGLNWLTILQRRQGYRNAFDNFDISKVASYGDADMERLLNDPGIIRNRRKVTSAINNARLTLDVIGEFGSFDRYIWQFVGNATIDHGFTKLEQIPAYTDESVEMSKALKKRGFAFVGPTICYSFMQAVGMVNDHLVSCFRHDEVMRTFF
ncbi:MAG TPA: DNA-3-methyladenine glycosylase I [Candidatus Methanofastidiosa archaeon]|nr:DNA-3-methyladenine glycosylase I [Candidatus Methanofastidiosa archaeon]